MCHIRGVCEFGSGARKWERSWGAGNGGQLVFQAVYIKLRRMDVSLK